MDIFGGLLLVGLIAAFVAPVFYQRGDKRTLRGLKMSRKEWALLGDIAALKQVSQSKLVSGIVKEYLHDRVSDRLEVGRRFARRRS